MEARGQRDDRGKIIPFTYNPSFHHACLLAQLIIMLSQLIIMFAMLIIMLAMLIWGWTLSIVHWTLYKVAIA